jgi:hypothetical protein
MLFGRLDNGVPTLGEPRLEMGSWLPGEKPGEGMIGILTKDGWKEATCTSGFVWTDVCEISFWARC